MRAMPVAVRHQAHSVLFGRSGGGFPTWLGFSGAEGGETISQSARPWLTVELPDGSGAEPFWPEQYQPTVTDVGEAKRVEFRNLPWRKTDGSVLEGFRLTQRYEFWPDGVCFVRSFFVAAGNSTPDLSHFRLRPPVSPEKNNDLSWAYWERPDFTRADIIQALGGIKRFLQPGNEVVKDGMLLPFVSFDFGHEGRRDKHLEWFLEGSNSPGGDPQNVRTSVRWNAEAPELEWDFLCERRTSPRGLWQWRNQWCWTMCRAPLTRRHPPLRFHHWIDSSKLPTDAQIQKMAEEGADLLVLHECWRSDVQNGAARIDEREFRRVIEGAHRLGMRMAVYVRGNEPSVREDHADWFDEFFQRDYDGLYMDYGSPIIYPAGQDETYACGRIAFREYYLAMREVRKRVGERGVFFSHAGPFFAACGMTGLVDGYVAGEGERGVLLSNRTTHAYFSGVSVAAPTMWTAAFPDYETPRAVPFLASIGQVPHIGLGTQIGSSSLQHPCEPGVVTFARPVWKLWGILRGQEALKVLHQQNTSDIFLTDSDDTAACLFVTHDGSVLLLATNFSAAPRSIKVEAKWPATGVKPESNWTAVRLNPHANPPRATTAPVPPAFEAAVPGYGVVGWFLTPRPAAWQPALEAFRKPYPTPGPAERAYDAEIEALRKARFEPSPRKHLFVRLAMPQLPIVWEDSIWWDTYDNWNELVQVGSTGERELLGYVSARGLVQAKPEKTDYLWPGTTTPWIALHELLPAGRHELAVYTVHHGEPFYSFVRAEFTSDPAAGSDRYTIRFANELDSDRSRLTFAVHLLAP